MDGLRLVRGSHIITHKLYKHEKSYILQGEDGRVIFTIPYENDFTLIGTTDVDHPDLAKCPVCSDEETEYLLAFASSYFRKPVLRSDIIASFSGVRPLYDDGANDATAATRDYVLRLDDEEGIPLLNIFGGKITTYRRLSESILKQVEEFLGSKGDSWTNHSSLPGGDIDVDGQLDLQNKLQTKYPFLTQETLKRVVRSYGTISFDIFGDAEHIDSLGKHFGSGLYEREVAYLIQEEWARTSDDILFRRSKLGLSFSKTEIKRLDEYIEDLFNSREHSKNTQLNSKMAETV